MVLVVYAHPYPDRSRANRALLHSIEGVDGVCVRALYDRYPDFHVDVRAEQHALEQTRTIVLQHPLYWYAPPALIAMWFEKVLVAGWAFGEGGNALRGKRCLWVVTTGSPEMQYGEAGVHGLVFDAFAAPVRQTMALCGIEWLPPVVVHAARTMPRTDLDRIASAYRTTITDLVAEDAGHDVAENAVHG